MVISSNENELYKILCMFTIDIVMNPTAFMGVCMRLLHSLRGDVFEL